MLQHQLKDSICTALIREQTTISMQRHNGVFLSRAPLRRSGSSLQANSSNCAALRDNEKRTFDILWTRSDDCSPRQGPPSELSAARLFSYCLKLRYTLWWVLSPLENWHTWVSLGCVWVFMGLIRISSRFLLKPQWVLMADHWLTTGHIHHARVRVKKEKHLSVCVCVGKHQCLWLWSECVHIYLCVCVCPSFSKMMDYWLRFGGLVEM